MGAVLYTHRHTHTYTHTHTHTLRVLPMYGGDRGKRLVDLRRRRVVALSVDLI